MEFKRKNISGWLLALMAGTLIVLPSCRESKPESVTVPFVLDHNRMLVEAEFQLKDSSWHKALLWVDTGNPDFFISEEFAGELGIELSGSKEGQEIPAPSGVRIGGMTIDFDSVSSSAEPGVRWLFNTMHNDGNLPSTVLKRYHVIFDYPAGKITIAEPGVCKPRGVKSPATINPVNGIIQLDAVIDGENYSFALDNGASFSYVPDELVAKLVQRHPEWPHSNGAVGCANIWGWWPAEGEWPMVRVPEIRWGAINIEDAVIAGLPPIFRGGMDIGSWYSHKTARPVNGFFGPNIFKAYRIEVDYLNDAIYFEKGAGPGNHDMDIVGITIKPLNDKRYEVIGIVMKEGIPTIDGIKVGDILLQVDDLKTSGATMGTVVDALKGKPGDKHTLTVERDGKQFRVEASVQHIL